MNEQEQLDRIRKGRLERWIGYGKKTFPNQKIFFLPITKENAQAEGGYTPEEYEKVFSDINPKWDGWSRWAFEFHVIEVQK